MTRRLPTFALLAAAAAVSVAGCSSSSGSSSVAAANASSGRQGGANATAGGGRAGLGTFGRLAEIDGTTLQVQSPQSGQVAVSYSSATTFRRTATVSAAAVKVGECVVVTSADAATPGPSAPSTPSTSGPATVIARSVGISQASTAGCLRGSRRGLAGRPGATQPSGFPTARPDGDTGTRRGLGARDFGATLGKVTAVTGTGFTVVGSDFRSSSARTTSVRTNSSTTFTETLPATATALKVGQCIVATGATDTTGAVKARSITMSPAGASGCTFTGGGLGGSRRLGFSVGSGGQPTGSANA